MLFIQFDPDLQKRKMVPSDRKVILELNEHDAMRLLALIEDERDEGDKVWYSYWERLARQIKLGIEQAGSTCRPNSFYATGIDDC